MEIPTGASTLVGTTGAGKEVPITVPTQQFDVMFINTLFMENHKLRAKVEELERQLAATETSKKTVEKTLKVSTTTQTEEDDTEDIVSDAPDVDDEVKETVVVETEVEEPKVEEPNVASDVKESDPVSFTYEYGCLEKIQGEDGVFRNYLSYEEGEEGEEGRMEVFSDEFEGFKDTFSEPHVSSGHRFEVRYKFDGENVFDITFKDGRLFNPYDSSYKNKNGTLNVVEKNGKNIFSVSVGEQNVATTPKNFFNQPDTKVSKHIDTSVDGTEVEVQLVPNRSGGTTQFALKVFRRDGKCW